MQKRVSIAKWIESRKYWQINVQKDGIRRSFYSSTLGQKGKRECHSKADAWLDENIENTTQKVSTIFDKFILEQQETTSKSNYIKLKSMYKNWLEPNIGNIKIEKINEQHLQSIINKACKKQLSKKSLQNIKALLIRFIKFCRKSKVTKLYPENLNIPKNAQSKEKRILQPNDLKILFSSDKTISRDKEIKDTFINAYRFQVATGLRPGELMALKWENIIDNNVHIKASKNYLNEFTKGKNSNAIRKFTLTVLSNNILEEQKELQKTEPSEFIFGELNLSTYAKHWNIYCKYNKIEYVSLYELRHTFVSIAKNLPEGQLKPLIGHSKDMDTFGIYGHEVNGERIKVANELDLIFNKLLDEQNEIVV